jgi:Asp-tRNA(Asn)/Glu-tRNA(Gln) amidotransferase A subunit family amidase
MFTISTAAEELRHGRLSAVELLQSCLERIDRYEPRVKAWVFVDRAGARKAAERADQELRSGQRRGPLHGIPIGIKDIFDVFDWPTAAGSKLWTQSIARRDATVVERVRRAGAVFVGKTVTTAYASMEHGADARRLQQRLGGGAGLRHVPGRPRFADRRLDHTAGVVLRGGRPQADIRPRQL